MPAWAVRSQRPRGGHPRARGRLLGIVWLLRTARAPSSVGDGACGVSQPGGRSAAALPLATCQRSATSPEGPGLPASLDPRPGSGSFGHMTPLPLAHLGLTSPSPTRLPWCACLSGSGFTSQESATGGARRVGRAATCRGRRESQAGRKRWGSEVGAGGFCCLNV